MFVKYIRSMHFLRCLDLLAALFARPLPILAPIRIPTTREMKSSHTGDVSFFLFGAEPDGPSSYPVAVVGPVVWIVLAELVPCILLDDPRPPPV